MKKIQNAIKIEENSVQYNAKITSNLPTDKNIVTDGMLTAVFQIKNTGNIEIMPSRESKIFFGHQIFSTFSLHFFDLEGKEIGEPKIFTIEKPIPVGGVSDKITVKQKLPLGASSVRGMLDCKSEDEYNPCKQPIIESHQYAFVQPYMKVLIVDASRKTDKIGVPSFRSEIEKIYGNSNFLKAAWSSIPVGPKYASGALLLYNTDKGRSLEGEDTKTLLNSLNKVYGKFYQTEPLELSAGSFDKFAYQLSDCGLDDSCETNLYWDNLTINSNRFSPSILTRNDDIDFIIFLPSNS